MEGGAEVGAGEGGGGGAGEGGSRLSGALAGKRLSRHRSSLEFLLSLSTLEDNF